MNIEHFKKAKGIVSQINALEALIKKQNLGEVSDSPGFTKNNRDFYKACFINVFATEGYHDTRGGGIALERLTITEYKDKSGQYYHLTKSEIIEFQNFLKNMLEKRMNVLYNQLESI